MEMADIDVSSTGEAVEHSDKVALIDADTLIYASAFSLEVEEPMLGRSFYTDEEYEELINNPTYWKEKDGSEATYSLDLDLAYQSAKDKIQTILDNTGCEDYELHFTGGKSSFRYTLIEERYKANRIDKRRPVGIRELRDLFVEREPERATIHTMWEADDAVVSKFRLHPGKYLLVAVDKDVLYSVAGRHYNYYSSVKYNIPMKWVEVDEERAMKQHYLQAIMGDAGDNVIGVKGMGPKKAEKLLASCSDEESCWDAVVQAHKGNTLKDGSVGSEATALKNMRLVSMHQVNIDTGEVELWTPKQDR